tara:strand:+ start:2270 stop:3139 length:870 start_codon:yes stop_codon:yes gene_type:complete
MNYKRVKHSKYKNTGLIFEFLLRQITSDLLNDGKKSSAVGLIKKFFNGNTELGKELGYYNLLVAEKYKNDKKADYFITEVLNRRKSLNNSRLRREKYNLIKTIKENYNVENFFSSRVPNYKIHASIFKLFEYSNSISPEEKTESYFNILEHVTTNTILNSNTKLNPVNKKLQEDEDLRILTYKTLLERFNNKYDFLSRNQKVLLREYINNISNNNSLNEYFSKKIPELKRELKRNVPNVKNKVTKIKLTEAINSINKFCLPKNRKIKTIKDINVVQLMRYYELLNEIKK